MQSNFRHHQFNTMPKQVGVIASYWSAINCGSLLSLDRTPEGYISQGFIEGAGYA
jgi:hypothetical protein